ncbi:GTP cyclohydrolase II [Halocynthiibacter namhaensis]|uniref:GTP cyclohydrolase II n=1 Tax=Halocynthiibacter namhaensis TaxID=1290553 RepID=UPI000578F2F6|nr:GTP cyclohydrolase II [Halocynthiibacter namhaensis]
MSSLFPTIAERLARARSDLRMGMGVVLSQDGAGILAISAEAVSTDRLTEMRNQGDVTLTLTSRRAETLKIRAYDGDIARLALPRDAGVAWVRAMADPADDLLHPMKGPWQELRGGDCSHAKTAIQLAKTAQILPAILYIYLENSDTFARDHDLTVINAHDSTHLMQNAHALTQVVHARLPMTVSEAGRLHVFRTNDGSSEHYAVEIGSPDRDQPALTRLHSACFTGDVIGSLKCDCGPQLNAALAAMGQNGAGILLYLNQEGRGIGLANKMRAYSLQDQGFDTVEANHRLGFEDDERDFRTGAEILKKLGFKSVRLMTNNPAKVAKMQDMGIEVVERVGLKVGETDQNRTYLATKAKKSGHLL